MEKKKIIIFLSALSLLSFLIYQKVFAAVPTLKEGTYLTGQTLSVWPSWSVLGSALGQALPVDPLNRLGPAGTCVSSTNKFCLSNTGCSVAEGGICVLHDPTTGWSTADRRFSFACNRESYAYRYIVASGTNSYTIRAHFEDAGLSTTNFADFVDDFVSTTIVKIDQGGGVCNFNEEISTIETGRCGDGKLNLQRGEQCDPPGRIEYQANCDTATNKKNLTVCNSSCQWVASTTPCNSLSKCGNGRKESGEVCDEGGLNGRYNHCNITCSATSTLGWCGNGDIEKAYEICDPGIPGKEKYSLVEKAQSCSWDCQNWGPYCGDKIVQSQYGETCDGSQTCSIGGRQGTKVCSDTCKRQDKDVLAWWNFEELINNPNRDEMITKDSSVEALNEAICATDYCPRLAVGQIGKGLEFGTVNFNKKFLEVSASQNLKITNSVTVEAWVKPTSNEVMYQRVVEQGGALNKTGFDLELNVSSTKHTARFNLWKGSQTGVDSESSIPLGVWTHIIATYEKSGNDNTIKMYVNGVLENTTISSGVTMADPEGNLFIGRSGSDGDPSFFFGSLDEVKIYNRALSADEVRNNFQTGWVCVVGAVALPVAQNNIPASCGNSIVNANEACDRGVASNGQACTASYGQPCSYCSANCQNIIDVQPLQYCGNGIIEQREKCDVLSPTGTIFASATNTDKTTMSIKNNDQNGYQELTCSDEPYVPHVLKKGTKSCGDCTIGVVRNCVSCGLDPNGVSVEGGIINVLVTSTSDTKDPLFTRDLTSSSLRLSIGVCSNKAAELDGLVKNLCDSPATTSPLIGQSKKDQNTLGSDLKNFTLLNPYAGGNALINSNLACSRDEDSAKKYLLYINRDWSRPLSFPVLAQPQPWQYDLVLSPVIRSATRNKDVRVVVSWVAGEFYGGILNPFVNNPDISGPSYCNGSCTGDQKKIATGVNYYNTADSQLYGVWYHGLNSTAGRTEAESFTINTADMSGNTYSFYVRSPSSPIRQFKNTARLKVDVYLPENDSSPYHFGTPVKTYYFNTASPSDNPNAKYWHVFNINRPEALNPVSVSDILDVNTIFTGSGQFVYFKTLVGDNNPVQNPNLNPGNDILDSNNGGPVAPPAGGDSPPAVDPNNGAGGPPPAVPLPVVPAPDAVQ